MVVVVVAGEPKVVGLRLSSPGPRHDVVELEPARRTAAAAGVERPGAAAAAALPDGAADGGGLGVAWARRRAGRLIEVGL